jgi:hypothetical protein
MVRGALSLFLAATIATCPFFCTLNGMVAKAVGKSSHACPYCCHSDPSPKQSQPAAPDDSRSKSRECCQCICGGAVSGAGSTVAAEFDTSIWSALPVELVLPQTEAHCPTHFAISQLQPDDGANLGRAMRCLFMSFLC